MKSYGRSVFTTILFAFIAILSFNIYYQSYDNEFIIGSHLVNISINSIRKGSYLSEGNEDFFSYFIREAPKHGPDYEADTSPESIPWLDRNLMEKGADIYHRHFIGIYSATFYSGIELFAIKSTSSVLLNSGTVATKKEAYQRILRTIQYMIYWCSTGMEIFNPGSPAYKSMQMVRRKHQSAVYPTINRSRDMVELLDNNLEQVGTLGDMEELLGAIKSDLAHIILTEAPHHLLDWNSTVPMSQFDLGVVSFIIFSHVTMHPHAFGIYGALEDFIPGIHGAAVIGRLLGVQDRFNVALNLPPSEYTRFYKNIVVASLKNVEEPVLHLMGVTMNAISENFLIPHLFSLKCWLHFSLKNSIDEYEGNNILKIMTLKDRMCLLSLRIAASPLNLSPMYVNIGEAAFTSWLSRELVKFNAKI